MNYDLYPEKAQYITLEPVKIILEGGEEGVQGLWARLRLTRLQKIICEKTYELCLGRNEFMLEGQAAEFGGYGVFVCIYQGEEQAGLCSTAFDVVSDCSKAIRYGFLSDFNTQDGLDCKNVGNLRKFHINMVQYYDWSYRHDNLVSEERKYKDMMGREVDLDTVRNKISACRKFGMKSLGYGAVYAASGDYYKEHRDWALYTSAKNPLIFIDTFYIMNIAKDCGWRKHIIEEYARAVSIIGFDGIHMDTYGFPKTAYSYDKRLLHLDEEYSSLIQAAKDRLNEITPDNHLIFNNVGNWPVAPVADTPQDALYIEVWEPYVSYSHIRQLIREAKREWGMEKPVILAAYLEPFRTDSKERAANAAYLLTAAITANGASHLLLGEENGVLTQGYYVEHSILEDFASEKMRRYYDFIVQYLELFYDAGLQDVSMTHLGWDNTEYRCLYDRWSADGQPDRVWLTLREKESRKLISLINLCGNDNTWNRGKENPSRQEHIIFQIQIDKPAKGVYLASPDYGQGQAEEIPYQTITTDRGWVIEFEVACLDIWSTVWVDF